MSPLEIGILLHYYACADDHEIVSKNPPIWESTREFMMSTGLLETNYRQGEFATYALGERGKVFVEYLMTLPLPEWRMPDANRKKKKRSVDEIIT